MKRRGETRGKMMQGQERRGSGEKTIGEAGIGEERNMLTGVRDEETMGIKENKCRESKRSKRRRREE